MCLCSGVGGGIWSVKQPSGYLTLPSGLCCFYLWKVEEKRSKKQQHKKNQRIHDYTAKLRNRTYGGNISLQTCLIWEEQERLRMLWLQPDELGIQVN